jgi:hypothetical protein
MKAKTVKEFLNEAFIPVGDTREMREKYAIFKTPLFAVIANGLQQLPDSLFVNGKLDIDRFYNHLKRTRGIKHTLAQVKETLLQAAPILSFTDKLKLSREERSEAKFQEKAYHNELPLEFFDEAEVTADQALRTDWVLRSDDESTETAYYRFDQKLSDHEVNMLKVAYVYKYGDPEKTLWQNYLDARPARLGHIEDKGKSLTGTRDVGSFSGAQYD